MQMPSSDYKVIKTKLVTKLKRKNKNFLPLETTLGSKAKYKIKLQNSLTIIINA